MGPENQDILRRGSAVHEQDQSTRDDPQAYSRRDFLKVAGAAGVAVGAAAGLGPLITACGGDTAATGTPTTSAEGTANQPTPAEIEAIAAKAYPYGLQQVIYVGERWIYTQNDAPDNDAYSGLDRFYWVRTQITPDFPAVAPNATTLYGSGFLDLRQEPIVIEMPAITDRYFSLQLMDQYGIFHTIVGSPFNGTKARNYLFVPPGFEGKLPGGFPATDIVQWPGKTAYAIVRMAVEVGSDEEIATINAYQDRVTATRLSDWVANGDAGVPQAERALVKADYPVYDRLPEIAMRQVDKETPADFFTLLNMVLNDESMVLIQDSQAEAEMLDQLRTVGIGTGLDFRWDALPDETRKALETGFKSGFDTVRTALTTDLIDLNGWQEARMPGDFETDWLDRAVMADAGWGGPDKDISHAGAYRFVDDRGEQLHGANAYTITFDVNDLPQVTEFWSVPIYDIQGYFVANEIDRYEVNSFMLEHGQLAVKDDKLVVYVQHEKPKDTDAVKNWLPAPPEEFRFTARFYGPYQSILDGSYKMPVPVRTDQAS